MKPFPSPKRLPQLSASLPWLALAAGLICSGCQTVAPWERGILAEAKMNPDRDPLRDALAEHMWFSREAASGGRGIGGGGCGCN